MRRPYMNYGLDDEHEFDSAMSPVIGGGDSEDEGGATGNPDKIVFAVDQ